MAFRWDLRVRDLGWGYVHLQTHLEEGKLSGRLNKNETLAGKLTLCEKASGEPAKSHHKALREPRSLSTMCIYIYIHNIIIR